MKNADKNYIIDFHEVTFLRKSLPEFASRNGKTRFNFFTLWTDALVIPKTIARRNVF